MITDYEYYGSLLRHEPEGFYCPYCKGEFAVETRLPVGMKVFPGYLKYECRHCRQRWRGHYSFRTGYLVLANGKVFSMPKMIDAATGRMKKVLV